MSRSLFLLLLTCLMAHALGVSTTRSRLNSRVAQQHQALAEADLSTDMDMDMLVDADSELDEQALADLLDESDLDDYADVDADMDMDMDVSQDAETETDMSHHVAANSATEMEHHDMTQISLLESMTSTSTSSGVSYVAFGDKGLQGSDTEYGVVLNKQPCGVAVGVTGGFTYYDIIEKTNPKTGLQTKKFGKRNVATINIAFDRPNPVLTKWIKETLEGKYPLRDGAVQADDGKGNLKASLSFKKGYISEVTFPRFALDDPTPAIWKIKISPSKTLLNQAEDGALSEFRDKTKKFKPFANNFRFFIEDKELKGVRIMESFVVKTQRADPKRKIKPLYSVGNIVFEVSQDQAGDLFFWMEKMNYKKKNGAITVFKPSGKVFYSIALKGMGIYKVHPMRSQPRQVRWLRVEIFVEQVKFEFDPKSSKSQKTDEIELNGDESQEKQGEEGDDTAAGEADA